MRCRRLLTASAGLAMFVAAPLAASVSAGADPGLTPVATGADPFRGLLASTAGVDYPAWQRHALGLARARAQRADLEGVKAAASGGGRVSPPISYTEAEPAGSTGANETFATGETITGFGVSGTSNRAVVSGQLADTRPAVRPSLRVPEDNGSIPKANDTGLRGGAAIRLPGMIGDGPHGSKGDGSGDFDWFRIGARPGETITADLTGSRVPCFAMITDARGNVLSVGMSFGADNFPVTTARFLTAKGGTFFIFIEGMSSWQNDPFDSGSGSGVGEEGRYLLTVGSYTADRDTYLVRLAKGDVLGASLSGAAHTLGVQQSNLSYMTKTTDADLSGSYPPSSPLPGGGNAAVAYVAERDAVYAVTVENGVGRYDLDLEVYRPGPETDGSAAVQTVVLDFDGATVDPGKFGGTPGSVKVSPLSAFLTKWGLKASDLPALTDKITQTVTENLRDDVIARGGNPRVALKIVNGQRAADTFGQPNVAKAVVGGTVAQLGLDTVGISEFIDPGNFSQEDQAIILLDHLSSPAIDGDASLNTYLKPGSNRVAFVGTAIGNVVSHEIGHLIGNYHTDNNNQTTSLMDAGGAGFWRLFGTGPDKVGGNADDTDTDLVTDRFMPDEPFLGFENTLNVAAWGFSARR